MSGPEPSPLTAFARAVASYVQTHIRYESLTKEQVAVEAVMVVLTDPTAAREAARLLPSYIFDSADGEPSPDGAIGAPS